MAAVKVSDIRAAVRINLEDPVKYNEVPMGIGAQISNQRVYQLPTYPVVAASEVVTIDNIAKTRNVDYTINNESGQLFFSTPPQSGSMAVYWQYATWSDAQLNQWITEATRTLSLYLPKLAKTNRTVVAADTTTQGWQVDAGDLRVYRVRSYDPPSPVGSNLLYQEISFWTWDEADRFLRVDADLSVGDQFQVLSRRRWADPDLAGDSMDPGMIANPLIDAVGAPLVVWEQAWPTDFNDPIAWLAASLALEKKSSQRDVLGQQGDLIDPQSAPAGGWERDAQLWRKKFTDWVTMYRSAQYSQHPHREPYWL